MSGPDSARKALRDNWDERAALARLAEVRATPPARPMPAMDKALRRALAPILKEAGPAPSTLAARWEEIVGPRLAAVTEPLRVAPGKNGATLHLRAPSAAAPMIQHAAEHIMEKVALATGAKIKALKVVQTSAPASRAARPVKPPRLLTPEERLELDRSLAPIQTPAIRDALERLGEAVLVWRSR